MYKGLLVPCDSAAHIKSSQRSLICSSHMLRDELRIITSDKWDSEVWGAASPSPLGVPRAKLYFYFAKQDHWVADKTRDDLIKLRSRGAENDISAEDRDRGYDWWPRMEIDGNNVPHGFCLSELPRPAISISTDLQ